MDVIQLIRESGGGLAPLWTQHDRRSARPNSHR